MKSYLVWAKRFKLLELKSQKQGTYNQGGSKQLMGEGFVKRTYADQRNLADNNELYVLDEEKTTELMLIREENIKKQAEESQKNTVSTEDKLAQAMVKAMANANAPVVAPEPVKEPEPIAPVIEAGHGAFEDLKLIIKDEDLGIRIGKEDTREKIEARIKEAQLKK